MSPPTPRACDGGGTNALFEGMKFFGTYMKCQSWTDPGRGLICRLRDHLSNSVELHDRYYENWKHGRVQTLGLDTDSRLLCSEARVEKNAVVQGRHGMIVEIRFR